MTVGPGGPPDDFAGVAAEKRDERDEFASEGVSPGFNLVRFRW